MKRSNHTIPRTFSKGVPLILIICIIGVILLFLTAGQSPRQPARHLVSTFTASVTPEGINAVATLETEADVTNGLILAGALLIVVILLGTLHATWGLIKPNRSP